ncbi:MAG: PPOX class F420-dependent oxidoreductase [Actinomycetota bacterium]
MELTAALAFAREHRNGVLSTQKRDGRPQLSNIIYTVGDDGLVRISITADRAKYPNIVRDPRVSVHISRDDFWAYVVIEGDAELSPVALDPHDATVDELVDVYRAMIGEHPDWDDYRTTMVKDQRCVVRVRPTHAYGMLPKG